MKNILKKYGLILLVVAPVILSPGCSTGDIREEDKGSEMVNFTAVFGDLTRVSTDLDFKSTWVDGDEIGVFAVRRAAGESGELSSSANYAHNVKLTYNSGTWSGGVYWPSSGSTDVLDFYAYYPYDALVTNPLESELKVSTDQYTSYDTCDLLIGKADNNGIGYPRGTTVDLVFDHALAMVQVDVSDKDPGVPQYTDDLTVTLKGLKTGYILNLAAENGSFVTLSETAPTEDLLMSRVTGNDVWVFRAVVPAQSVADSHQLFNFAQGSDFSFNYTADAEQFTAGNVTKYRITLGW